MSLALMLLCSSAAIAEVQTWWHDNAEANDSGPVAAQNVRQSTGYRVRVAPVSQSQPLQDSFVYMSIPRSGLGKVGYTDEDGAEFSGEAGMSMSWSSFLYDEEAWVYVELVNGPALTSADQVTIRPTRFTFEKELVDERTVRIRVPNAPEGFRFSVEFDSQLMTSYEDASGRLTTRAEGNRAVHVEPRHGLMIFAESIPRGRDSTRLVPDPGSSLYTIHYPAEGKITNLSEVTADVIYFRPGTYYMDGDRHAELSPAVRWLYVAPGAYVKGAFQFRAAPEEFPEITTTTVSGFGVISGEQYVYEADRANGYRRRAQSASQCHGTCVKLLEFEASPSHDHLRIHGFTLANAPYHSFVIHGSRTVAVDASNSKQVGGWYWQTDGIEMYDDSRLSDMFFHINDDVLKLYGSRGEITDVVVWKLENGPVIQWGWTPRNLERVHVDGVDVIHNRMHGDAHNSCLINSARHFIDPTSEFTADPAALVSDMLIANVRSEGMNLCAVRLYALSSWRNIHISNLWIERWNELDPSRQVSRFHALLSPSGERVAIGNEVSEGLGVALFNFRVGDERITRAADNWRHDQLGRLDFDAALWEHWNAK